MIGKLNLETMPVYKDILNANRVLKKYIGKTPVYKSNTFSRFVGTNIFLKNEALQKIESHEKLCRIMQKQTHDKMNDLQQQINRIERILLVSAGALLSGMAGVIIVLLQKL